MSSKPTFSIFKKKVRRISGSWIFGRKSRDSPDRSERGSYEREKPQGLYPYLEGESRSLIRERNDFHLEFIRDIFGDATFSPIEYLAGEYERVHGFEHSQTVMDKLDLCVSKTSVSLKELVQDNYLEFIECFDQTQDIESFFTRKGCNIGQLLLSFGAVLRKQEELHFDLNIRKEQQTILLRTSTAHRHSKAKGKYRAGVVIAGSDVVDSPSAQLDDIAAQLDERKWPEAMGVLRVLHQDMGRGEYAYLSGATRKQVKRQMVRLRHRLFAELAKLLRRNAYNKTYRRRLAVYVLQIPRCFDRGIALYFECKAKELEHNIEGMKTAATQFEGPRAFMEALAFLVLNAVRELIHEFNAILVESGHFGDGKDAYSSLTVFVLTAICRRYVDEFRKNVLEATRCAISLSLIGECLKLSLGYLSKLKWHGLCLEMCVNDELLAVVVEALELYFADHSDDTRCALLFHDAFVAKQIELDAISNDSNDSTTTTMHRRRADASKQRRMSVSPAMAKTKASPMPPTLNRTQTMCVGVLSPRKKRRSRRMSKYEAVAMDISVISPNMKFEAMGNMKLKSSRWTKLAKKTHSHSKRAKTRICVTSSTKLVYDVTARCLLESRALLSFSVFPEMAAQLLTVLMEQLTQFLQSYCSRLTQILRKQQSALSEKQSVAILADVFFISDDLVRRIHIRLRRHCRVARIERILSFQKKLNVLHSEQLRFLAKSKATRWMRRIIDTEYVGSAVGDGDANENERVTAPSKVWFDVLRNMLEIRRLCVDCLLLDAADAMTTQMAHWIMKLMFHGTFKNLRRRALQRLLFDVRFFGFAVAGFLDDATKQMANRSIVERAVAIFESETKATFADESEHWYRTQFENVIALHPELDLRKRKHRSDGDDERKEEDGGDVKKM